ncbi:MAG: hypothetical protein HC834_10715 [Rhodospirillales bacterium]|nr:hypothetical protein [Rhodospirillales bacterium]
MALILLAALVGLVVLTFRDYGVTTDEYVSQVSSVAHRLRDTLDPAALCVLVQMPSALQLVCRATVDAIDMGEIARALGGGGHGRAAAATVEGDDARSGG